MPLLFYAKRHSHKGFISFELIAETIKNANFLGPTLGIPLTLEKNMPFCIIFDGQA
jgi:hypothetical protein